MDNYSFFLSSSLEKVFPDKEPKALGNKDSLSIWKGSRGSIQLVYYAKDIKGFMPQQLFYIEVLNSPCPYSLRSVELIPSDFPVYGERDDNYITDKPGLFPDLLKPLDDNTILPVPGQYRSIWITFEADHETKSGSHNIKIKIKPVEKRVLPNGVLYEDKDVKGWEEELSFTLNIGLEINKQKLIHTEWFHTDCLANYYNVDSFSPKHFEIIENFIESEHRHNVNMILTPIFTPPLDTRVGGERKTVQLVDVFIDKGVYSFDFHKLKKWCTICKRHSIKYLEIPHFFTQWGATSCPKIKATVDGEYKKIFGWETSSTSKEYKEFLHILIPLLQDELTKCGYDKDHVFYHISDEPNITQLDDYKKSREIVKDVIDENQIIDALSNVEFYKKGIVPHPIPSSSEIEDFYKENIKDLWVYYCCAQCKDVPNRFFSMPSPRNRIMGVLMYLYDIKGFLHWGFNFYNSKFSLKAINPYINTHADFAFPSGDAFLVYPGEDGKALDSIRSEVQDEALLDLRALQTLESLTSRAYVETLIYDGIEEEDMPFTFTKYPRDEEYLLNLREHVFRNIESNR